MNFTALFSSIVFTNPWILAGLTLLPALWFVLRVTPPVPRRLFFPPARLVRDLLPETAVPSHTPWPILLLRLAILSLILLALARPVINPGDALPGDGPVRIVMDNGWAAAQTWPQQMDEAKRLVNLTGREKREIYLLTTAPAPGTPPAPYHSGPITQAQAESALRALAPLPWPADYEMAASIADKNFQDGKKIRTYWLSHGLKEGGESLLRTLARQGDLTYIRPEARRLPILLRPDPKAGSALSVLIDAPSGFPSGTPVTVNAMGAGGRILDSRQIFLDPGKSAVQVVFDLPDALRNRVEQFRLSGRKGAGAVLLLDDSAKRHAVAIATPSGVGDNAPLLEDSFYLERALAPYANISSGTIQESTAANPAVIILPNVGAMPPVDLGTLEEWIKKGGLLLRFAGPNMIQGDDFLTPVPLLKGGRALDGAMTWEKPVKIAPFPESSPFYGLPAPADVVIKRQLLAQPAPGLEDKVWAALEDGTPLVTAAPLGDGMIVLIHTTATPLWSDLPLSGFFIDMLRRIVSLAGRSTVPETASGGALHPLLLLDGNGALVQPRGSMQPVPAETFDKIIPNPAAPPGLYGRTGYQRPLNLGERLPPLESFSVLPARIQTTFYEKSNETDLLPVLLTAAFFLFLIDGLVMAALQAGGRRRFRPATALLCFFLLLSSPSASAQTPQQAIEYAGGLHLAYMRTGNPGVDSMAQRGLESLADTLAQRTSVEPSGVVGLTPEEELSFFPLIYWPVTPDQPALSARALQNIQHYIDHGGTIFFDTRDHAAAGDGYGAGGTNALKLRAITGGLNIPPLAETDKDHVLGKSFYLLEGFTGRHEGGALWVETQSAIGRDGVSSVIVGSNDWAAAWAGAAGGSARQHEMTLRFGVNLVMYALTGNYKTDQVHLPHIMERLGR